MGGLRCCCGGLRKKAAGLWPVLVLVVAATSARAGTTLTGEIALRQEYDSNIHRDYSEPVSEWTTTVAPAVSLNQRLAHGSRFFRYAPSLVYNDRTHSERVDHELAAGLEAGLRKGVQVSLNELFVRAEDPYDNEEAGIELADARGRNRYWTNRLASAVDFQYGRESFWGLSYVHQVLDNSAAGREDYVKHVPGLSIVHLLAQQWKLRGDYTLTKGDFDQSDDLLTHAVEVALVYRQDPATSLTGGAKYARTDYDGLQNDYAFTRLSLGLEKQLAKGLDFSGRAGGILFQRDNSDDTQAFFYDLSLDRRWRHASLHLAGKGGIDEQQFNGVSDEGVSRYWSLRARLERQLTRDVRFSLRGSYRDDTYLERDPARQKEERYQAEAGLSYAFWRWFQLSLKYVYSGRDADVTTNNYDDNRLLFELSSRRDLSRWE